ncbi:MAG: hypothetical protein COX48_05470 [bacterium (Candidatus Stahlbacteria) CG23_combo_of_CG06-09_8_20_14_all_34_7]|nr:MAG: hypothetical protein COX48_05470 [bacterium (Candidatus Stahlbacteria) CG23_combo_of_CG06-09_8_20_14_all_34_7]
MLYHRNKVIKETYFLKKRILKNNPSAINLETNMNKRTFIGSITSASYKIGSSDFVVHEIYSFLPVGRLQ